MKREKIDKPLLNKAPKALGRFRHSRSPMLNKGLNTDSASNDGDTFDSLTGRKARGARLSLKQSQSKVAKACGINRSYLSQFEHGHRKLADTDLKVLFDYLIDKGWREDEGVTLTEPNTVEFDPYLLDDFVVAPEIDEATVEALVAEYENNANKMDSFTKQKPVISGFPLRSLDDEKTLEKALPILLLAYRQNLIIQQLKNNSVDDHSKPLTHKEEATDLKEYIDALLPQVMEQGQGSPLL